MLTRTVFARYIFVNKCHGHSRWSSSSCFFFPGQGAQSVGMCKRLLTQRKVLQLFDDASKVLGYDLLRLCLNGPAEELNKTANCQPAIVVASLAALEDEKVKGTKVSLNFFLQRRWNENFIKEWNYPQNILNYSCILIGSYLWSIRWQMHIVASLIDLFVSLLFKTNRLHIAVHLFCNRLQKSLECGNISDTISYHLVQLFSYHI